jgi:hypothetical protein
MHSLLDKERINYITLGIKAKKLRSAGHIEYSSMGSFFHVAFRVFAL